MTTLFKKYGGFAEVQNVVSKFYDRVLENDSLAPYFERTDMAALVDHQTKFISSALGGPDYGSDESVAAAHAGRFISEDDWNAVVQILEAVLREAGFEDSDVEVTLAQIATKKRLVVQK